jgi:hypothetical protein
MKKTLKQRIVLERKNNKNASILGNGIEPRFKFWQYYSLHLNLRMNVVPYQFFYEFPLTSNKSA